MNHKTYNYSDFTFSNGIVNIEKLEKEIRQSSIEVAYDYSAGIEGVNITLFFKAELSETNLSILDSIISSHDGKSLKLKGVDEYENLKVTVMPTTGVQTISISQNFCDKTTWLETAILRENEIVDQDNLNPKLFHLNTAKILVDVTHGKLSKESWIQSTYQPKVYVNNILKTEKDPDTNIGDYSIDYLTGDILFVEDISEEVKMTYYEVQNSKWSVSTPANKRIRIKSVEMQYSTKCRLQDSVVFTVYGQVGKHPALTPLIGMLPNGYEYPLYTIEYKTMMDFINETCGSFPILQKTVLGENETYSWRDLEEDCYIMRWDYTATIDLKSSYGMKMEAKLKNDIPPTGGKYAIVTFYTIEEDDE